MIQSIKFRQIFHNYNILYLLIVVLCTARATVFTSALYGYNGDIISSLLLVIMTIIFIIKNNIRFSNQNFIYVLIIYFVWFILQYIKYESKITMAFYVFYQLIIAYSITYVFGKNIFYYFESFVTKLSIISLFVWILNLLFPTLISTLISPISLTTRGGLISYNILVASVLDTSCQVPYRNPGFSWEPGMNAAILCTAIFINLVINKFKLGGNKNLFILLLALLSSFSTTGYVTLCCVIVPFYLFNVKRKYFVRYTILLLPIIFLIFQLDFMSEKILKLQYTKDSLSSIEKNIDWRNNSGNERTFVPQRFDALALEVLNIKNDPIIGYGVDYEDSFVFKNISEQIGLPDGLLKLFAQFGLIVGSILLFLYFKSSVYLAKVFNYRGTGFFLLLYLLISVSYQFFNLPLYMSFMLFPFFKKHETNEI